MTNFPILPQASVSETVGMNTGSTVMAFITPGVDAKGSWTQIVAATSQEWHGFVLFFSERDGEPTDCNVDISLGASSNEANHIIVDSLPMGTSGATDVSRVINVPIHVPAGSRISARAAANAASNVSIGLIGFSANHFALPGYRKLIGVGVSTGAPNNAGVNVSFGGSNSEGSWTEIVSSLSEDIAGFYPYAGPPEGGTSPTTSLIMVDVGVGGSGSERAIMENAWDTVGGSADRAQSFTAAFFPIPISAGTRIAMRGQVSSTSVDFGCAVLGLVR